MTRQVIEAMQELWHRKSECARD